MDNGDWLLQIKNLGDGINAYMVFQSTESSHEHPQLFNSYLTCPAHPYTSI